MRHVMITTAVASFVADRVADLVTFAAVVIAHATNRQLNYQHLGQRMPWLPTPAMPSLLHLSERSAGSIKPRSTSRSLGNMTGIVRETGRWTDSGCC